MIPKQLFFLWFGDTIPKYISYAISNFKKINPTYSIDLIYYNKDEILSSTDGLLETCKNLIFKTKNGINNRYYQYIKHRLDSRFNYIQLLSDLLRFELLYYYGGIYLDCDTYPNRPFEDSLLNHTTFAQSVTCFRHKKYSPNNLNDDFTHYYDLNFLKGTNDYHYYSYHDIYFVGAIKEYKDISFTNGIRCSYSLEPSWIRNLDNSKEFKKKKDLFYKCELPLYKGMFYSQYITHFCTRKWQTKNYKQHPLYCELDDKLYGTQV